MEIHYPYLPEGRKIEQVGPENVFICAAKDFCFEHSTDDKQPTGAVIVSKSEMAGEMKTEIIGFGANQTRLKNAFLKKKHEQGWCVRKILNVKTGEKYWLCPGCSGHDLHAEAQAIADAKKNNKVIGGADLYLWGHWWCCQPCWDKMIESGIKNVYLLKDSEVLFNRSNPNNLLGRRNFDKFS